MVESFAYDLYGNVTTKTLAVSEFDDHTYGLQYEYNGLGGVWNVSWKQWVAGSALS